MKNLKTLIAGAALFACATSFAATPDYSWVASFKVGPEHNHTISHDAAHVCFDGFICAGKGMHMSIGSSINGITIKSHDLDLERESTKADFITAMTISGLAPIESK